MSRRLDVIVQKQPEAFLAERRRLIGYWQANTSEGLARFRVGWVTHNLSPLFGLGCSNKEDTHASISI